MIEGVRYDRKVRLSSVADGEKRSHVLGIREGEVMVRMYLPGSVKCTVVKYDTGYLYVDGDRR